MSGYGGIAFVVSVGIMLFLYTLLYDVHQGFYLLAVDQGADPTVMGISLILWQWYPLVCLLGLSIGYLVESQRRSP